MSNKPRTKKKKVQAKPRYTKLEGYQFVSDAIRRAKQTLESAAKTLTDIDNIDSSDLLVGEITGIEENSNNIRKAVPTIVSQWDRLNSGLDKLVSEKGSELTEFDFRELMDLGMQIIQGIHDFIVFPMEQITGVINKSLERKNGVKNDG